MDDDYELCVDSEEMFGWLTVCSHTTREISDLIIYTVEAHVCIQKAK